MAHSPDTKARPQPPRWPIEPAAKPADPPKLGEADHRAGRIVHDDRGNAVWNWVKETGRICIDSTSALLKKLDFGDLKIDDNETRGSGPPLEERGRDAGGGYDPYNRKTAPKKPQPSPPKK